MDLTLVGDGTDDLPYRPRRYRFVLPVVIALVLGGGTAFLLTDHGRPAPAHGAPAPSASPTDPGLAIAPPVDGPSPSPSAAPGASPSPTAHRGPTPAPPAPHPSVTPSHSPSPSTPPAFYDVKKPICGYLDMTPFNVLTTPPGKPDVTSNTQHFQNEDDIFYYCNGVTGNVVLKNVGPMWWPTANEAAVAYAADKTDAPENSDVFTGIGSDAWGFYFDPTTYRLTALAGNIMFEVIIQLRKGVTANADKLRDAAVTVARATVPKLRVS